MASAATPKKRGRYAGSTSQGKRLSVRVNRQGNVQSLDTSVMTTCGQLQSLRLDESDFGIPVHRGDGSFSDIYTDTETGAFIYQGQALLQVAKHETRGKFNTRRSVTGTIRVRSVFYFNDLFPDNSNPVDKCDTGVLSWTARLRR